MQTTGNGEVRKEERVCAKHGEYMATLFHAPLLMGAWIECGCPLCEQEREDAEKARDAQEREDRAKRDAEQFFAIRGIPLRYRDKTLDDIMTETPAQEEVKRMIAEYLRDQSEISKNGKSLIFYGQHGTGKTHIATSIIKAWDGLGYYISAREYTRLLRETYSRGSAQTESDIIGRFDGYDILAIDEIGKQFATENERYAIFDIINQRYNDLKPTILISNMNLSDIEDFLGSETVDRLKENGGQALLFEGNSYRRNTTENIY